MALQTPFQLEIPRRSRVCCLGGEPLFPGAEYYSVLHEDSDGNLMRQDYCISCWQAHLDTSHKSFWKSKVKVPKVDNEPKPKWEMALQLLKDALSLGTVEGDQEAFVLALFLAHGKQLIWRQEWQKEKGDLYQLYEVASTEEILPVKRIEIPQEAISQIQQRVSHKLALT